MNAEWVVRWGTNKNMWPAETCDWVAHTLAVPEREAGQSCVTYIALVLERHTDPHGAFARLKTVFEGLPDGSMTPEDHAAEARRERAHYDRWRRNSSDPTGQVNGWVS